MSRIEKMRSPAVTPPFRFAPFCEPARSAAVGCWELIGRADNGYEAVFPDGRCELIFHLGRPAHEWSKDRFRVQPTVFLYGPLTRALILKSTPNMRVRAVRFTTTGPALLGAAPEAWRNRAVSEFTPWTGLVSRLEEAAYGQADFAGFFRRTQDIISRHCRRRAVADLAVAPLVQTILEGGIVNRTQLASHSGWSVRHLTRLCRAETGYTPGELARIGRFQRALRAVKAPGGSLARIALAAGYADQAHMTREFVRFAATTPHKLRTGVSSFDGVNLPPADLGTEAGD